MSFGFSVGDFLAVGELICDVVSALRGQASFEYRELVLELEGLQHALHEIEHLPTNSENEAAVNAVKVAALICKYPLDEFRDKIKKYSILQVQGSSAKKRNGPVAAARKVQWNFSMPEETAKLRCYLAAHVGSLNMRLQAIGFQIAIATARKQEEGFKAMGNVVADLNTTCSELKTTSQVLKKTSDALSQSNALVLTETRTGFGVIQSILMTAVVPQIQGLLDIANNVWTTNIQIMNILTSIKERPPVDIKHTWFQEPIKFEDAFGRVIPVPSEYGWSKLHAIIMDQFACGPGHDKVFAGEYELFDSNDSSKVILSSNLALTPGMGITMAVVIGRYENGASHTTCPKPGCRSKTFRSSDAGGTICTVCQTWFGPSRIPIPRPFRLLCTEKIRDSFDNEETECTLPSSNHRPPDISRDVFRQMRNERKWFKNMRIHRTELSDVPGYMTCSILEKPKISNIIQSNCSQEERDESSKKAQWTSVKKIIAEELGVSEEELLETLRWDDLGVDSLMSLAVTGLLRENLDLNADSSLFSDCPTVESLRLFIESGMERASISVLPKGHPVLKARRTPRAKSLLLSGRPKSAQKIIWCFPDELGSLQPYLELGSLGENTAVFGIVSPYINQALEHEIDLEDLAASSLQEIYNRQPSGPYTFVGWSIGALVAYEAINQLIGDGEVVEDLIVLDCLFPNDWLGDVSMKFYHDLEKDGLLKSHRHQLKSSDYDHIESIMAAFECYPVFPILSDKPRVSIFRASEGVKLKDGDDKTKESLIEHDWIKFLKQSERTYNDSLGWNEAFRADSLSNTVYVPGNHFTMMQAPNVEYVTTCIRNIVA